MSFRQAQFACVAHAGTRQDAPSCSSAEATTAAHRTRSVRGSRLAACSTQLPNMPCASHRVVGGVLRVPPPLLSPGGLRSFASCVLAAGTWCRATSSGVSCGQKKPAFSRASSALGRRHASRDIHSRRCVRLRPYRVPTRCTRSMVSQARYRAALKPDNRSGGRRENGNSRGTHFISSLRPAPPSRACTAARNSLLRLDARCTTRSSPCRCFRLVSGTARRRRTKRSSRAARTRSRCRRSPRTRRGSCWAHRVHRSARKVRRRALQHLAVMHHACHASARQCASP